MKKITKNDLIKFENEIIKLFNNSKIRAPVHLHYGNEENLIKVFKKINPHLIHKYSATRLSQIISDRNRIGSSGSIHGDRRGTLK